MLGADNGVAIAATMALAEDAAAAPWAVEAVDDGRRGGRGCPGAFTLDPELISGQRPLNLDSEEDASPTVGPAPGALTNRSTFLRAARGGEEWLRRRVTVGGGRGGHSGRRHRARPGAT